jgi:hypothetical protein
MERALQCNREGEIAKTPEGYHRRKGRRRWVLVAVSTFLGFLPWRSRCIALAAPEAEPIRLVYHAPPGCPDEAAFVARVRARTARARLAWAGETARTFTVALENGRQPFGQVAAAPVGRAAGRVVVQSGDHSEATRQVQADTCSDVADALALMVALAIDPSASAPTVAATPEAPPAAPPPSALPAPSPAPRPTDGGVFGGVDLALAGDVVPQLLMAGSPYVGWRSPAERLWSPAFRVAFVRAETGTLPLAGGSATFTWTVGRLDGCPIAWPRRPVRVSACVRVEAGTLQAAGVDVPAPQTALQAWVSAGPLARAEWSFLPPVFVDVEAGALVRLTQDRFLLHPSMTPAFEVAPVGATAGVGVGALFF